MLKKHGEKGSELTVILTSSKTKKTKIATKIMKLKSNFKSFFVNNSILIISYFRVRISHGIKDLVYCDALLLMILF